jgi:hypothetical protein
MRPLTLANIAAPMAREAHGVLLPAKARIIRTSGQIGLAADGAVPENVADLPGFMAARDAFLDGSGILPASTLLLVSGFSRPEFKIEIEVMATAD